MPDLIELFGGHFMSPIEDPWSTCARMRRDSPVLYVDLPLRSGYLIFRYDDVLAVLRDATTFASRINAEGIGLVMGRTIIEMDGKEHTRTRNIVSTFFVPKTIREKLPPVVDATAHSMIDAFANDGRADLVTRFTTTFPLRIVAGIIGIPIADYEAFQRWALAIIGFPADPGAGFEAAQAISEFLRPIADERRREPKDDLLSALVHAEVDGERLTDEEVVSFLRLLLPAGAETTYRLIGNTLAALLAEPELLEEVRADRSLVPGAVEEALRWESAVGFTAREATVATSIGGVEIPAGTSILTVLGSANRDERHYEDPERFDPRRGADDHLAFGFGKHFCLGSHLARLEATVALNALLDRLPRLRLEEGTRPRIVGLAFRSPETLPVRFD